jgi:DedD protein
MERKLQERMVGAGVLILALVILGPVILSGGNGERPSGVPNEQGGEIRSHTFSLDRKQLPPAAQPLPSGAPRDFASPAPVAPVSKPAPVAAAVPVEVAKPAAVEPVSAPAPAVVKSAPTPEPQQAEPPRKAAADATGGGWVVQVGTFGQKANADRLVATIRKNGFDAFISATDRGGKPLYRVRVGPAGTREAASEIAARLAQSGQTGQVVSQ